MQNNTEKTHADKLLDLRRYYLTRKETAKKLGVSYRHTGRLLKGTQPITPVVARVIDLLYEQITSDAA